MRVEKKMGAAAILLNAQGHVLLVKHSYGRLNWELPGGGSEAGESVAETAVREVREETGLSVAAERLTGIYFDAGVDFHHFVFVCRQTHASQEPQPDGVEITDCGYWPPDALPRPLSDFTERRIQDAQAGVSPALPVAIGPRLWRGQETP